MESSELYSIITETTHDEYETLVAPGNHAAHLMFVHFFVVEYIAASWVLGPIIQKAFNFRKKLVLPWLIHVQKKLPPEYLPYMEWPMKFGEKMFDFDMDLRDTRRLQAQTPS